MSCSIHFAEREFSVEFLTIPGLIGDRLTNRFLTRGRTPETSPALSQRLFSRSSEAAAAFPVRPIFVTFLSHLHTFASQCRNRPKRRQLLFLYSLPLSSHVRNFTETGRASGPCRPGVKRGISNEVGCFVCSRAAASMAPALAADLSKVAVPALWRPAARRAHGRASAASSCPITISAASRSRTRAHVGAYFEPRPTPASARFTSVWRDGRRLAERTAIWLH